ncbi:GNAT family N-acetyltransferase [Streptomyces sp. NPDC048179]|uniref:GNAT family N-acetyltransferase n=1 Tax=Streptomyces sp. NPDC048179 TaxID=3365506 RepID=UPI0037213892
MPSTSSLPRQTHALLADGTVLLIRPARPDDHVRVLRLYRDLSPESLRYRFFTVSRSRAGQAAAKACAPSRAGYLALVAQAAGRIVGVAEYDTVVDGAAGPACAEIALTVADDWHGRGVGTLLLEHLAQAARVTGIRRFTAEVLTENRTALRGLRDLGLPVRRRCDGTETHCALWLE